MAKLSRKTNYYHWWWVSWGPGEVRGVLMFS